MKMHMYARLTGQLLPDSTKHMLTTCYIIMIKINVMIYKSQVG